MAGSQIVSNNDSVKLFEVALHEIGHAIGLGHYDAAPAVMNAYIDPAITDLTQPDIDGAQAIYGAPVSEKVASLIKHGTPSPHGHSQELSNNSGLVEQLYETALHRPGDSDGLQGLTKALNPGAPRADAAIDLALNADHLAKMQTSFDQNALNVEGEPVSAGISGWTGLADGSSFSFKNLAQTLLNSPGHQNAHPGQGDAQFIDDLYVSALSHHAESAELQGLVYALAEGASHEFQEAQQQHLPQIEKGWLLA